jgi:hypothetical protein
MQTELALEGKLRWESTYLMEQASFVSEADRKAYEARLKAGEQKMLSVEKEKAEKGLVSPALQTQEQRWLNMWKLEQEVEGMGGKMSAADIKKLAAQKEREAAHEAAAKRSGSAGGSRPRSSQGSSSSRVSSAGSKQSGRLSLSSAKSSSGGTGRDGRVSVVDVKQDKDKAVHSASESEPDSPASAVTEPQSATTDRTSKSTPRQTLETPPPEPASAGAEEAAPQPERKADGAAASDSASLTVSVQPATPTNNADNSDSTTTTSATTLSITKSPKPRVSLVERQRQHQRPRTAERDRREPLVVEAPTPSSLAAGSGVGRTVRVGGSYTSPAAGAGGQSVFKSLEEKQREYSASKARSELAKRRRTLARAWSVEDVRRYFNANGRTHSTHTRIQSSNR